MSRTLPIKISVVGLYKDSRVSPYTNLTYTDILRNSGFTICEINQSPEMIICIDYLDSISFDFSAAPTSRKVLIRNEPEVVLPSSYSQRVCKNFDEIITLGTSMNFPWPQTFPDKVFAESEKDRVPNRQVFINSNKFSFVAGELYSLRLEVISQIESVDTFGKDWDKSKLWKVKKCLVHLKRAIMVNCDLTFNTLKFFWRKPLNLQGSPIDKLEIYRGYKVAIVIENSAEYLSEKLFDAFFGGCIPVYVGPSVELFGVPRDLVVQVGPTLNEVKRGISIAETLDYDLWKLRLETWITKEEVRNTWLADRVYTRLAMHLSDFLDS